MKRSWLCLFLILVLVNVCATLAAEPERQARRIINHDGWKVPGRQWAAARRPTSAHELTVRDRVVKLESFSRISRVSTQSTSGEVSVIVIGSDTVTLRQIRVTTTRMDRYSFDGDVFCYYVTASPIDDGNRAVGGVAGISLELAYYDDDRDGRYEVLEFPDPVLRAGETALKVRLPKWLEAEPIPRK